MDNPLQTLVARRLEELGLGPVEAATKAGLERTYIRDIVEGKKRSIRSDKIEGLARALQMDPAELGGGASVEPGFRLVPVMGYLQAGAFAETWEWSEDQVYRVPVPDEPALKRVTLHAGELRGPSMNRWRPEGTVIIYADAIDTGEVLVPGKRYVIERERADGLREATVKKLWRDESGKLWLLPESDDPRFQTPIAIEGNEDDTIRIIGRVRYAVSSE
jgi:SOS-response transcriptional repressor LexA